MALDLSNVLVVGISSRALFELEAENEMFDREGIDSYTAFQLDHTEDHPAPGTGFHIVRSLLSMNDSETQRVEVIVLSRNNAATSLRVSKAIEHYGLNITRSAWTGGAPIARYLGPYKVDLFLSAYEHDVQDAINSGYAAARIYAPPEKISEQIKGDNIIRIAFDGDAVLFSEESEKIFQEKGLEEFVRHEKENAMKPLPDGPFATLLRTISRVQQSVGPGTAPIRTALITARNSPAHERVIRTLHAWGVRIDEVHFLGGVSKYEILAAFGADIFFDDQDVHCSLASQVVPTAIVPIRAGG